MKKILGCILILSFAFSMVACENYEPKQEDFELTVTIENIEVERGEPINCNIKLIRKDGESFAYKGSSTLYSIYFESVELNEAPFFNYNDDLVKHRFSKDYEFIENKSYETIDRVSGSYIFAVQFKIGKLEYNFDQKITII